MALPPTIDDGGEDWEGGPLENEPRDEAAPELPDTEQLDQQLSDLEEGEPFPEPEIADEGVSPVPDSAPLEQELQTLEEEQPFEFQKEGAAPDAPEIEAPNPELLETPEDGEEFPPPPATLEDFYKTAGKTQGGMGALPGMPAPSQDGPVDPLKQYLDSSYSLANAHNDFLLDHSQQLDTLLEGLERGRQ
jgi:hypothetical protein